MAQPLRLIKAQPDYTWDAATHTYRTSSGRAVSARQVRAWTDAAQASSKEWALNLTERFKRGEISFEAWITQIRDEIKGMHTALTQVAIGGSAQWSPREAGRLGARLRNEYDYLGQLGRQIEAGLQPLDGALNNRVGLFVESGRGTYEGMRRGMMADDGMKEEMRVLGAAHHCEDCPPISGEWQPIGTLPEIGDTACLANCGCSFEYR